MKQQKRVALCEALLCFCLHSPDGVVSFHDIARRLWGGGEAKAPTQGTYEPGGGGPGQLQVGSQVDEMDADEMLQVLRSALVYMMYIMYANARTSCMQTRLRA